MNEKVTNVWEKVKSFFDALSKSTKILIAVVLIAVVLIFLGIWVARKSQPYGVVFYDLSSSDLTAVSNWLKDNGIDDFKIDGSDILVPSPLVEQTKAALYMESFPTSGSGYQTYYEHLGPMSTDADKEQAYIFDLQDRLAGVIRNFSGVKEATVTIAPGEDRRYVLDSTNITQTTATVSLVMSGNQGVSSQVATSIRLAVNHAVSDLQFESVIIIDNLGNSYADTGTGVDAVAEASSQKFALEEKANNQVRTELMWLLTPIYGDGNVRISVKSTIDINRKVESSTEYPMPEWGVGEDETDGRGLLGSEVWSYYISSAEGSVVGGVVGANPNSDIPMYPYDADGDGVNDTYGAASGEAVYKNPETVTQTEFLAGTITDVQVGVTINSNSENAEWATVAELITLIGTTSGIQVELHDDKVSVLLAPFVTVEESTVPTGLFGLPTWVLFAIAAGLALFVIIIIVIIMLMRKKKREEEEQVALEEEERLERERQEAEAAAIAAAAAAAPAPEDGADIMDVNTEKSMELRKDLRTFVGNNPEIAASLLRNLMKGGEVDASES